MAKSSSYNRATWRISISILAGLAWFQSTATLPARADDSAVTAFMHVRHSMRGKSIDPSLLSAAMSNPSAYQGRTVEISGTVSGLVASGSDRTVLLTIGQQSLTAALPATLRQAMWIEVDQPIRALFVVDSSLKDSLRMVAAAPESEAAAAERRESAEDERAVETSRSMAYSRDGSRDDSSPSTPGDDGGHPSPALPPRARAVFGAYHAAIRKFNHHLSDDDVDTITNSVLYFSAANDIDPRLIVAMIIAESDFNIYSRSHTGAMGLGQLMPETARNMGVTDPYDPEQNIAASARILRGHLDQYGGAPANAGKIPYEQIRLIMAAYNAGPGAVKKYHGVPPYRETQRYVERVATLYREMCGD